MNSSQQRVSPIAWLRFANRNQNTKQKHPTLNAQGLRNWIRQRFVSATGHTRGRWV